MSKETALVTGASSGIGLELARLFAADKSNLILVARSRDKLERLAEELQRDHNADVVVLPKDLTDPSAPRAIFDQLTGQNIDVDVVVNNAGFGSVGSVADLPLDRQLNMIQVNVTTLTYLTRLFLPGMIERGRGGILNVGSTAGFQPGPNMAVYYATKAFVLSFTEALAEELAGLEINVTCLAPGATENRFRSRLGHGEVRPLQVWGDEGPNRCSNRLPRFSPRQSDSHPRPEEPNRGILRSPGPARTGAESGQKLAGQSGDRPRSDARSPRGPITEWTVLKALKHGD